MADAEKSDPSIDWDPETARTSLNETVVATAEPVTAPNDARTLPGYEIGFRDGTERRASAVYEEGQRDIMASARHVLLSKGLANDEAENLLKLFWQGRTQL